MTPRYGEILTRIDVPDDSASGVTVDAHLHPDFRRDGGRDPVIFCVGVALIVRALRESPEAFRAQAGPAADQLEMLAAGLHAVIRDGAPATAMN